tara:strand:+ start:439 stop:933 length:495 start_codon:yes stop_codon:yes gene_type:complete
MNTNVKNDIIKYFGNPLYQTNSYTNTPDINEEDKKFYRKRVLAMGKEIYSGKHYNEIVNQSFENFISLAISHCQMIDKRDLLQEDYPPITTKANKTIPGNFNINDTNEFIMRHSPPKEKTLDTFVKVTTQTNEDNFIPKERKVDLKQKKLKTKGINKKKKDKNV